MKLNNFSKLIISVIVCELVGVIGSIFTVSSIPSWYAGLAKPALNPPSWVFGPVWIVLYFLMGMAAFLIWSSYAKASEGQEKRKIKIALGVFGVQLFLNAIWSIIFFGLRNPGWAFVEIIFLWLAIIWVIIVFYKISRLAALLLLPYILWVSFAAYLNYSIWQLQINVPETTNCEIDSDCAVFGKTGDCNCGCYNKNNLPSETGGECFCAAPISCKCANGKCEGIFRGEINDFDGCVEAGYAILESYPRQCRVSDGRGFIEDIGNELEKSDLIRVSKPRPNETIISPLKIRGEARGFWFFEASFPVKLFDANGLLLAAIPAQASGDWMTEDFVSFEAEIEFQLPETEKGTLILEKDNPSGIPEYGDELEIPVRF